MKKEHLRKIIESRLILDDYSENYLRNLEFKVVDGEIVTTSEDEWVPKIDDLKEEFDILKQEIRDAFNRKNEAKEFLEKDGICDHSVIISNYNEVIHCDNTCALCGRRLYRNYNFKDNMRTITDEKNKFIVFKGREEVIPYGFNCDGGYYVTYYTLNSITKIILDILDKIDTDEVDIVDEIKKLNLEHCRVIYPSNDYFVLFIIGSNREYFDKYSYLDSTNNIRIKDVIEFFSSLYGTTMEILGDVNSIKEYQKSEKIYLETYEDINGLVKHLQYEKEVPYHVIVDASSLFTYEIKNNEIIKYPYFLDLEEMFPDSKIVHISDFNKDTLEEIKEYLLNSNINTYAYQNNGYYQIEGDKLKTYGSDDVCSQIKRLIKRRESNMYDSGTKK